MTELTIGKPNNTEEKYSTGSMFLEKDGVTIVMLCQVGFSKFSLVSLQNGNRSLDPIELNGNAFNLQLIQDRLSTVKLTPIAKAHLTYTIGN